MRAVKQAERKQEGNGDEDEKRVPDLLSPRLQGNETRFGTRLLCCFFRPRSLLVFERGDQPLLSTGCGSFALQLPNIPRSQV